MKFGDALSFILLIDKVRDSQGKGVLTQLPTDYEEKLRLHIPENLSKLLVNVVLCLLDKRGFNRLEVRQVAALVDKAGRKEYGGMFEAVIESFNEAWERGLHQGREQGLLQGRDEGLSRGREEGREEGLLKGREEGTYTEKLRTAANFKQLGVSTEVIAQATGLSVEEIEGL